MMNYYDFSEWIVTFIHGSMMMNHNDFNDLLIFPTVQTMVLIFVALSEMFQQLLDGLL